ncbi:MAG: hypothetical protein V1738_02040 [Patescibacteria group bacterium]
MFSGIKIGKFVIFDFSGGISFKSIFSPQKRVKKGKLNSQVLFIDDEKFPIIDNLVRAGWNVVRIPDLHNPDDEQVIKADIIIVDYKGVGKTLAKNKQGLGIIKLLKEKYGDNKRVVLCSAYSFKLDQEFDLADNHIAKSAEAHDFISLIEDELAKL